MNIEKYTKILLNEDVVAIPTETVYGLAGSISSEKALHKIFKTKERPYFDPLIVHVSSIEQAKEYVTDWTEITEILAQNFWPGPLTFVLPKNDKVSDTITSGLNTVAIRMPNHIKTLKLIESLGTPVAAPSANPFKKTSPTTTAHVSEYFPDISVMDGGECQIGIESTIIGIDDKKITIYRPGMVTKSQIQTTLMKYNIEIEVCQQESPVAPGHLKHHYMPETPIIAYETNDIKLALTQINSNTEMKKYMSHPYIWNLPDDPTRVAREFYGLLKNIDQREFSSILILYSKNYTEDDKWNGILNRLEKAASFSF